MSVGMLLALQRKLLVRQAVRLGRCPEISPRGSICTEEGPHVEHATWLDGQEIDRWASPR